MCSKHKTRTDTQTHTHARVHGNLLEFHLFLGSFILSTCSRSTTSTTTSLFSTVVNRQVFYLDAKDLDL